MRYLSVICVDERTCMDCGAPIFECMGFVVAGDFLAALEAMQKRDRLPKIRERCGKCVIRIFLKHALEK